MSLVDAKGEVKEISIEAVVIRKDGTREDLGVISKTVFDTPAPAPEGLLAILRRLGRTHG
jgi:hypothetical protein